MNVSEYIESGVLQEYCLGLLDEQERKAVEEVCAQYPAVRAELEAFQSGLQEYVTEYSVKPPQELQGRIWNSLKNIGSAAKGDAPQLPIIDRSSDHDVWLKIVKPFLPRTLEGDMFIKVIRKDEEAEQTIIWTKVNYPDEVHDDLLESFMILEGECECYVDDKIYRLGPGGYFEIPLYAHHDVKILTPQVLAVLQRRRIA